MDVPPIKIRRDYRTALKHIGGPEAKRGMPEGDRLDVPVALVGTAPIASSRAEGALALGTTFDPVALQPGVPRPRHSVFPAAD